DFSFLIIRNFSSSEEFLGAHSSVFSGRPLSSGNFTGSSSSSRSCTNILSGRSSCLLLFTNTNQLAIFHKVPIRNPSTLLCFVNHFRDCVLSNPCHRFNRHLGLPLQVKKPDNFLLLVFGDSVHIGNFTIRLRHFF